MKQKAQLQQIRREYSLLMLTEENLHENPFDQFEQWFAKVLKADLPDPTAMVLSTVTPEGKPSSRIVLLKEFDEKGFVFFTNYNSSKGRDIRHNPYGCILFYWTDFQRQVKVQGKIEKVSREESLEYFGTRPRSSQVSAWASNQSSALENRSSLELKMAELTKEFEGKDVPCPEHWGGYRLIPSLFEFWQGRSNRLHDRFQYSLKDGKWDIVRLAP